MAFSIHKELLGGGVLLKVTGNIDEDANFSPPDIGDSSVVTLDLEGVTAINSVGIREWIKWIKVIPESVKIVVQRCPKIIVDQINMVAGFLPGNARVESFYVPYFADATGSEKMVLFHSGKEFKDGDVFPPDEIKDDSGELMEMDIIEAKYFKFLKNG